MGITVTLNPLTNLNNQTSAVSSINNNYQTIATGFSSALDTSGDQMEGQLDMNSNHIINLPSPSSLNEPARMIDVANLQSGSTITIQGMPVGGSTGYVLTKHSNTNFDTVWQILPAVNAGTALHLPFYSSISAIDPLTNVSINATSGGALTLGTSSSPGSLALAGATSGFLTLSAPTVAGLNTIVFPAGTTDFSATGGTNQVLKQSGSGAALTVGTLSAANLVNGTTGTGSIVLSSSPTFTGNNFIPLNQLVQETQGYSLLGNNNAGTANYGPFQLTQLTAKASPTAADILLISDQTAGGQLKQTTIGNAIASQAVGVASINGIAGALTFNLTDGDTVSASGSSLFIGGPGGFRNKFRNATLDIWQRGNTINVTTTSAYTADGWMVSTSSGTGGVVSQQTNSRSGANSYYCLRFTGSTAVTSAVAISQRIESYMAAPLVSDTCTFQAQIFNNTASAIVPTLTIQYAGTGQDNFASSSTVVNSVSLQSCTTSSWTQVAYAFTGPTSYNGISATINFSSSSLNSATAYIQIAELDIRATPGISASTQISTAPIPEMRPFATELALCQRYYEKSYDTGTAPGTTATSGAAVGVVLATANFYPLQVPFKTSKRATGGTLAFWDTGGSSNRISGVSGASSLVITANQATANLTTAVGISNFWFYQSTVGGAMFHWTVSSEL